MGYFLGYALVALIIWWINVLILRWVLGTDKLLAEARKQTQLLERIAGNDVYEKTPSSNAEGKECPSCGTPYNLNDYRGDAGKIFCSTCKIPLN